MSSLNNAKNISVESLDFDHVVNYPQPNNSATAGENNGDLKPLESLECLTAAAALASKGRSALAPS